MCQPVGFARHVFPLFLLGLSIAFPILSRAQTIEWVRQFGTENYDGATAVTVCPPGVCITGHVGGDLPGDANYAGGFGDAFARKYDANGGQIWTRLLGSDESDAAKGIAVDSTGIYIAGYTEGSLPGQTFPGGWYGFAGKYDASGGRQWISQFAFSGHTETWDVATDSTGVYLAGLVDESPQDGAFVRKYDANGSVLWTRLFDHGTNGSSEAYGVAVVDGGVYVVGAIHTFTPPENGLIQEAFVRKYDSNGNVLWNRQFGLYGTPESDCNIPCWVVPWEVAVDATGVYLVGETAGTLPGQTGAGGFNDAFVRKYDPDGNELWTRQFGSADSDYAYSVAVDATGLYAAGTTRGTLPGQTSAGSEDAFLRKYDGNGNELWTRQFGTAGADYARAVTVDVGNVYVAGGTSGVFPGQVGAGLGDAFVAKFVPAVRDVSVGGVVSNASYAPHPAPVAPGSIAAVFGTNLNDGSTVPSSALGQDGKLVTTLGGASVTVNGIPAPMFYSTPFQLGIQIPFELAGQTSATIVVTVGGQSGVPRTINLDAFAPGVFTVNQQGTGIAAVLHQDGVTPVTAQNPAHPNEVVVFFVTGLGAVTPALATGAPSAGNRTATNPVVNIDGVPAAIDFSGAAPGFVGLNQINLRIPASTRTASNIPVLVTIGGKQSNSVTIPVGP